jgi:hypothetical protein
LSFCWRRASAIRKEGKKKTPLKDHKKKGKFSYWDRRGKKRPPTVPTQRETRENQQQQQQQPTVEEEEEKRNSI